MLKIFIMCPGVGHIGRGYESFSRELFDSLKNYPAFKTFLFKGAGTPDKNERTIRCIKRNTGLAKLISWLFRSKPYTIEQFTFSLSALPAILRLKPDVIIYSDFVFGIYLWYIRKYLRLKYKLLFVNGAPNGPPYTRTDHVQQLLPSLYKLGIEAGEPASRFTLLPYGTHVGNHFNWPSADLVSEWKEELGLPLDKTIIISVGAVNRHHKRMDYLVKEFARLSAEKYFLLVLGSMEEESESVISLAEKLLLKNSYLFKTVPYQEIARYYLCSDIFVLCSLSEGFGRVYAEALMFGLPVFAHDYTIAREVLGEMAHYVDMRQEGALSEVLIRRESEVHNKEEKRSYVFEMYDWSRLRSRYIEMIERVAAADRTLNKI